MTKSELIEQLAGMYTQIAYRDVEYAVKATLEYLSTSMSIGRRIEIRGFGTFFLKVHKETTRFDMARSVPVSVPKKAVVRFMPGKKLRSQCKKLNPDLVAEYHGGGK